MINVLFHADSELQERGRRLVLHVATESVVRRVLEITEISSKSHDRLARRGSRACSPRSEWVRELRDTQIYSLSLQAPALARRRLIEYRDALDRELYDDLCIVTSELVSNAVIHSGRAEGDRSPRLLPPTSFASKSSTTQMSSPCCGQPMSFAAALRTWASCLTVGQDRLRRRSRSGPRSACIRTGSSDVPSKAAEVGTEKRQSPARGASW